MKKNIINIFTYSGIAGLLFFVFIVILLHIINAGYNPINHYISEYALLKNGWLLNLAVYGNFISLICISVILYLTYKADIYNWICIIGFILSAITSTIILSIFPADIHGKTLTISGYIHNYCVFIGTLSFLFSSILLSTRLKLKNILKKEYQLLIILAIISALLFIFMLIFNKIIQGYSGLLQRIFSLLTIGWMLIFFIGIKTSAIIQKEN